MGFPINTYTLLWSFGPSARPDTRERARNRFAAYPAIACVVASPLRHPKTVEAVSGKNFQALHDSTGSDVCFFAPVQAPPTWQPGERQTELIQSLGGRKFSTVSAQDPEAANQSLAALLGCPDAERAWLYVTADLTGNDGTWISTNGSVLQAQLDILTGSVRRSGSNGILEGSSMAARLVFGDAIAASIHASCATIAEAMATVAGAALQSKRDPLGNSGRKMVTALAQGTNLAASSEEDGLRMLEMLAAIRCVGEAPHPLPPLGIEYVEPFTLRILSWATSLLRMAQKDKTDRLFPMLGCTSVGQAVERHIMRTVGHVVRALLQIDLPDFYDMEQPNRTNCSIRTSPETEVRFNEGRGTSGGSPRSWKAPALGQFQQSLHALIRSNDQPGVAQELGEANEWTAVLANIQRVAELRNTAAHGAQLATVKDLEEAMDLARSITASIPVRRAYERALRDKWFLRNSGD